MSEFNAFLWTNEMRLNEAFKFPTTSYSNEILSSIYQSVLWNIKNEHFILW